MTKHEHAQNHVFYEAKQPSGQKMGSRFAKNDTPLERKGRFTTPTKTGPNRPIAAQMNLFAPLLPPDPPPPFTVQAKLPAPEVLPVTPHHLHGCRRNSLR